MHSNSGLELVYGGQAGGILEHSDCVHAWVCSGLSHAYYYLCYCYFLPSWKVQSKEKDSGPVEPVDLCSVHSSLALC